MSDKTKIEWTDATWNPVTGCTHVSEGCDHCYAESIATRFAGTPAYPDGFEVTLRPDKLDQPLRWKRPRRIFVNSMSDLFHSEVPDEYIAEVFAVMALAPQHTFQVLTKRPGRMRSLLASGLFQRQVEELASSRAGRIVNAPWPLPNVWIGTSVESQQWADVRIPLLLDTPAVVRFLSCEPLLGLVDLTPCNCRGDATTGCARHNPGSLTDTQLNARALHHPAVDWVIVGGESGPHARPMQPDWVRSIRDQCAAASVPFLFKQWGEWAPHASLRDEHASVNPGPHVRASQLVGLDRMDLIGKKAAGLVLDGRTWDEYPEVQR